MATMEQFQECLRLAVREALQKVLAEGELPEAPEGEAHFTTIETLALRLAMRSAWKCSSNSWRKAAWNRRTVRTVVLKESESGSGIAPCKRGAA